MDRLLVVESLSRNEILVSRRRFCRMFMTRGTLAAPWHFLRKEISMRSTMTSSRAAWVAGGLIAGLAIAYLCPHEPTYATTADRDSQFMMVTVPVGNRAAGID